jgi:hypothetical protein
VADDYGGIARVIEDRGDTLLLVNSLGKRYEMSRRRVRVPDQADFEGSGVARSFDPARSPEKQCARCGGSSRASESGKWYMMGWKPFCQMCAEKYAGDEGYIPEDQVSDELEPTR